MLYYAAIVPTDTLGPVILKHLFTSESVTEGHPDKVCDQIADGILDRILHDDPEARVACEAMAATGLVVVAGEITTEAWVDFGSVARECIADIGYNDPGLAFSADTCSVMIALNSQSPDIAHGVSESLERRSGSEGDPADSIGAGDQGLMFGYATNETPELMPLPIALAHRIARRLTEARKLGDIDYLRPDGKCQVTVEYDDGKPVRLDTILISSQHAESVDQTTISHDIKTKIIDTVMVNYDLDIDEDTSVIINPSGRFVIGGPHGDSGLTGRKIIVDTYGGYGRHGGGSFSGKDPTKVDRSATYAARYVAKNLVAAKLAERCEVQISYAIGIAHPVSVTVFSHGTGILSDDQLSKIAKDEFDLRPWSLINQFDLRNLPAKHGGYFYRRLASYGHFGRTDLELPWESLDKVERLKERASVVANLAE